MPRVPKCVVGCRKREKNIGEENEILNEIVDVNGFSHQSQFNATCIHTAFVTFFIFENAWSIAAIMLLHTVVIMSCTKRKPRYIFFCF